ncbi:MAG: GntR family transcriptional regulator [Bacteroidales bacterium]|nr:GntR family transcriptional regulator [Bacteroidales bacterium]MBN2697252.1 GntR family transcriptional regulator [Bacteroidales bacterium]
MKKAPQYRQLYEQLRKLVEDGIYKNGELLPSENELCAVHHLTRPTVRKALDMLVNDGFIMRQQGKGSIVRGTPKGIGILSLSGTTSAIGDENLTTHIIVKPHIRKWDRAFGFDISGEEKSVGYIHMERLRLINNVPVFYDITMIPNMNLPRFTSRNFENRSLFEILRKHYQLQVTGGEQKILAIKADQKIRRHFRVSENHPILRLDRKLETNRVGFCFYSQVYCNTENYSLTGRF